ncbi:MAG: phosphate signaling complex protein PhoU [Alphaproteobacteria bacterium]|nr:phosphate signaling complex protein PhoU [Alphaproteobacteria bacterium]MCW5741208.1 phosphate signaling complex protein PhoU [Alphaproteobacteria bacterium]
MANEHLVKSFDEELQALDATISEMGGLAESLLSRALLAVRDRDTAVAEEVIAGDARVDALERDAQERVLRMLALRQPMAVDLRHILSAIKITASLERIADYAKNTAKRAIVLAQSGSPPRAVSGIDRIGRLVQSCLKDVLDAFAKDDVTAARTVWLRDEEIDDVYNGLFRELLTYMMEDPRTITAGTHLMFMAKNIERIGDHVTNIAELVAFRVTGAPFATDRPKGGGEIYRPA